LFWNDNPVRVLPPAQTGRVCRPKGIEWFGMALFHRLQILRFTIEEWHFNRLLIALRHPERIVP
jgi:hypothetical protein